jgi:hypothetical protein
MIGTGLIAYHSHPILGITQTRELSAPKDARAHGNTDRVCGLPKDALKEPLLKRYSHRSGSSVDMQLGVNVPQMSVHRVVAERKSIGNFFFDQAQGH